MAKIIFLQNIPFEYLGPMYISAVLKQHGHDCRLLIHSEHKDYIKKIVEYAPDLIAFSTMTGPHKWILEISREIKEHVDTPVILGGAHPTFFPEIIHEPPVDMVCIGEGEYSMLELADKLDRDEDVEHIPNLWVKRDGGIVKNGLRPLIDDLDALPFPDRALYDGCKLLRSVPAMKFLTGRGCPYRCAFCFNHRYNELYKGLGKVVRKRSVESLIDEIKTTARQYRLKLIRFPDDTFSGSRRWLLDFLPRYKEEVQLPFTGLAHSNELTDSVVEALKDAGCKNMFFGVESGNESLRNQLLQKNLKDDQILEAARLLKKHKLKFGTYNMFGLPHETLEMAFETIRLNQRIRPDYTINNIFQPYPKTQISDYVAEHGMLDPAQGSLDTMNEGSMLQLEEIDSIVNLCRFASLIIRYPFLTSFVRILIKLPPNKIYKMIFDLTSAWAMKSNLKLNLISLVRWGIQLRKII